MRAGDLQQAQVGVVRQAPGEMHARAGYAFSDLRQKGRAPAAARGRRAAVADLVAADDENIGARVFAQDARQGAHEHMKAAIRLQVAGDEGDDGFARREAPPLPFERPAAVGGARERRVYTVVQDRDLALQGGRKAVRLPARRRPAAIAFAYSHEVGHVAQAQLALFVEAGRGKFRVEADVGPARVIVELAIRDQPGRGKRFFYEQRLAPRRVDTHDMRDEALLS